MNANIIIIPGAMIMSQGNRGKASSILVSLAGEETERGLGSHTINRLDDLLHPFGVHPVWPERAQADDVGLGREECRSAYSRTKRGG